MTTQLYRGNTWWRIALAAMRGLTLLGLVAAGISCAPSAESGDSARDRIFVDGLKTSERGIDLPDSTAIAAGHAVCSDLESDFSFLEAVSNAQENTGLSGDDAAFLTGYSIATYCPQFESSLPSDGPDATFLQVLEFGGINLPDSTAVTAGHAVCSDLESDVPFGEVLSNAEENTGLSLDDAAGLTGGSIGVYCPQFERDFEFLATLYDDGIDWAPSRAIAAGHALCADFESDVPFEEIVSNALDTGLSLEDAASLTGRSIAAYCPQFLSQFEPGPGN